MALINTGSIGSENLIFNQGYITVGATRLADLTDITVTQEFTNKDAYVIGSVKRRAIFRSELKLGFKATTISYDITLLQFIYGTSTTDGSGIGFSFTDGQAPTISTLVLTTYVGNNTTQPVQYQYTGAVIKSASQNIKLNDYGSMDIEVDALDCYVYTGLTNPQ